MRLFEGLGQDGIRVLTCLLGGDILRVPPGTELAGDSLQVPGDAEPPGWDRLKENLLAMKKEKGMRLRGCWNGWTSSPGGRSGDGF